MSDFFQNGVITTLHKLKHRPLEEFEEELDTFSRKRSMTLILPCLYSELDGPALPAIVEQLKHASYIAEIIIGLDRANSQQFETAKRFFQVLPQQTHILWNDGPRLQELEKLLLDYNLALPHAGKGRNVWYCLGYVFSAGRADAVALHDCDIVTYSRDLVARLFYPVTNPNFNYKFCKGYYARVTDEKLTGRLTRLFLTPLVRALINVLGPNDYLGYLDSFRYALSGEFSMQTDVINTLRIPGDWGLEVGVLSEIYRNYSKQQICQVDIADHYDHKHQPLSEDDASTGLLRMSNDIAKSIYRKLATQGVTFSMELFRTIKATYFRTALDLIEQYHCEAQMNGLTYERHAEERAVEVFVQSIINAGQGFLANPTEAPFIPNWNRVASAIPEFGERLLEAVEFDNRY